MQIVKERTYSTALFLSAVAATLPTGHVGIEFGTAPVWMEDFGLGDGWCDWHGRDRMARFKLSCCVAGQRVGNFANVDCVGLRVVSTQDSV